MKNHIVFKFIAVALCAASLLGAVGSGLGIFVMTESGLYEKTVDDFYEEQRERLGSYFAQEIATRYANINLGGCTEWMVSSYQGNWYRNVFTNGCYSYVLKDTDGNVVDSLQTAGIEENPDAVTYEFPVAGGTYMYVLSAIPESEWYAEMETEAGYYYESGETIVSDYIPNEGAQPCFLDVTYEDGSSEGIGSETGLGDLFHSDDGTVRFQSYHDLSLSFEGCALITRIYFYDINHEPLYEVTSLDPVGAVYYGDQGCLFFESFLISDDYVRSPEATEAVEMTEIEEASDTVTGTAAVELPLRMDPSLDSTITSYIPAGQEVVVENQLTVDGIAWGFTGSGWVKMEYVSFASADTESSQAANGTVTATVNIRQSPSSDSEIVGYLEAGDPVLITSQETANGVLWGKTTLGWVKMEYVTLEDTDNALQETLAVTKDENQAVTATVSAGTCLYTSPNASGAVATRLAADTEVEIFRQITVNGAEWGYTAHGWILLEDVTLPDATDDTQTAALTTEETSESAGSTEPTMAEETFPTETAPTEETLPESTVTAEFSAGAFPAEENTEPAETEEPIGVDFVGDSTSPYNYYDYEQGEQIYGEYRYAQMPEYTVELTLLPGALSYDSYYTVLNMIWHYRNDLFKVLGVSILLFAILAVYLCCTAGKKPGSQEIRAAGLNCIPLDLYLVGGAAAAACCIGLIGAGGEHLLEQNILVGCGFAVGMAYLACLIVVGFCFAFAAQVKTPGGYWISNSLLCRCLSGVFAATKWCFRSCGKLSPALKKGGTKLWGWAGALFLFGKKVVLALYALAKKALSWLLVLAKNLLKKLWNVINRFLSLLPLTWQWMLVGFVLLLWLLIAVDSRSEGLLVAWACFGIALVLYASHCFGILLESARRMSKGDLDTKVDDKLMVGSFQDFAENLNNLADVAVVAAQKQLKSERMKTELITNVSHDIKTPLTSIINYVDLLQKPHTDKEQEQYLEVLDRQSQRLKKLIDDLMEMSKASTGNLTVDIAKVDAIESVNQALGEFADKLDKVQLIPVFRRPEEPVAMMADGRLVWRVLSNLLSNAVKYAMPGTRLYIDLMELEGKVIISLKNISRDELNVDADELMERFVRGDDSRNTEGSGLGLNIAKSLMELQKGQLQLLVDGDLFKVTLIFPGA